MQNKTAIVLLSGGQDSTTCLYWAKSTFTNIIAICFDYNQKHRIELNAAAKIADLAKVHLHQLHCNMFARVKNSNLISNVEGSVNEQHKRHPSLPASFVPGRNLYFLMQAAIFAESIGSHDIVTGTCQTDYSGYPDCRRSTIDLLEDVLSIGMDFNLEIHTPLMDLSKKETVLLAMDLPGCMEALKFSHTCYNGVYPPCGECPSCKIRAAGFKSAGVEDPIFSRS